MQFLIHNGVTIFRVENDPFDDEKFGYSQFHYSVREGAWGEQELTFDVRDLPTWTGHGQVVVTQVGLIATDSAASFEQAIRDAIDAGLISQESTMGVDHGVAMRRAMQEIGGR